MKTMLYKIRKHDRAKYWYSFVCRSYQGLWLFLLNFKVRKCASDFLNLHWKKNLLLRE